MLNYKIDEFIKFFYNECDENYIKEIIEYFESNYKSVMSFFKIDNLDYDKVISFMNIINK